MFDKLYFLDNVDLHSTSTEYTYSAREGAISSKCTVPVHCKAGLLFNQPKNQADSFLVTISNLPVSKKEFRMKSFLVAAANDSDEEG
jgi:hypothetical protein